MQNILYDISRKLTERVKNLDEDSTRYAMVTDPELPSIVCFYGASFFVGQNIMEYENETLQYILLKNRVAPKNIERAIMSKALISNKDGVLTVPEYFQIATEVFCDDEVNTGLIKYIEPAKIIWTIIVLMAIYNADNIPVAGDTVKYIVACLKSDGWTMPPYMLNIKKFSDFFEHYDKAYYNSIICEEKELLTICGTNSEKDPLNAKINFIEKHKPILQYLHAKINELDKKTKKLMAK